ncbi:MAG: hypothetical protein COW18_05615 [Zetaproteobacteria bacterium CG12_big_fil_rev_8_21_14_0_65_54_13]|nr:MAG: hypothetical protein COW18_05615 [Zetaproteobacteria bacterium CG12_big_fil_rev_8_21_14_0_65_54_13]PIX55182.1 MAG: hypothetical protein COZ50_04155 [Zetaproteobacteria bacterium CG_4_10_14_3_um_filter_54_28]PJA28475.1 MAG: hypothetical protein CO188_09400 [Zetaproteobacteria bacterium CG_4_9_14_3_um_filter_54_145]
MIMPRFFSALLLSVLVLFSAQIGVAAPVVSDAGVSTQTSTSAEAVMQQFGGGEEEDSPQRKIETERKHQILFLMGLSLLVLLLLTATFGIAMVVFDKDVFIPHMIFAGLSMTLACVHSATAIAWFWPW